MHNPFEFTDKEKNTTSCPAQLEMFERLVQFVNDRLADIETLEAKVEDLENNKPNSND
tara:strand:+ start:545 stop:718 length:174 start_codon:yes stop_codon:yes gene_type:complete